MSDSEQNDTPFSHIDQEFKTAVLNAKKVLYNDIIFGPDIGTPEAQNMNLIHHYLNSLNELYKLSLYAKKGINVINTKNLDLFPYRSRESIIIALNAIMNYKKNSVEDILYEDYISNCYKNYQFILNDNFE